jgi:hypothetical protein
MGTHLSQPGVGHAPAEILDPLPPRHVRGEAKRGASADEHVRAFSQTRRQLAPLEAVFGQRTEAIEKVQEGKELRCSRKGKSRCHPTVSSRCKSNDRDGAGTARLLFRALRLTFVV